MALIAQGQFTIKRAAKDGQYTVNQYAKSTSDAVAPASGWASSPPTLVAGEYLWMRTGLVIPPATTPTSWTLPVRISGDKGNQGDAGTLNYIEWKDSWTVGNSAIAGWGNNGTTDENIREMGKNPFGLQSMLWKCIPNLDGNAAGGWVTNPILLDTKYAYRYSVFVKKVKSGTTYHGCYEVVNLNGTANTNPYFWSGTTLRTNEWFLMVGIIHPYAVTTNSGIGGVYDMAGRLFSSGTDYKFNASNQAVRFRSYLFYSSDATDLQYFFNPMVHRLDGTEPSINDLLQVQTASVVDTSFKVLDDKIITKANQTDFTALQGRVTSAESTIVQQGTKIESTVTKVDGKNAVYKSLTSGTTDRPVIPYAKNDLWITYTGEIKQSTVTRLTGSFTDSDWIATTKYTDDTAATNAQNTAVKKIRYIRDWLNGSTANTGNHWVQIMALNTAGTNVALNKTVSGDSTNTRITNGSTDSASYVSVAEGLRYVVVDLGAVSEISKVKVWHYNLDSRTYYKTKTEASADGINWFPLFDSAIEGTYKESTAGRTYYVRDYDNNAVSGLRNRTYYSDATPAVPEVGHKEGDLWYKISLTNGCYTTYRWNGSAWAVINEYVSKAQQTITDTSITNLVTKTGINSLGTGETLISKINQTADNITLEVGKVQIGGRNLLLNSNFVVSPDFTSWGTNGGTRTIEADATFGKVTKIVATGGSQGIYQNPATRRTSGKNYVISGYMKAAANMNVSFSHEGGTGSKAFAVTTAWQRFETQGTWTSGGSVCFYSGGAGTFYLANLQYEEGTKSSAWSPAPEDIPHIAGSALSISDNKIILASSSIIMKGTAITEAIKAQTAQFGGFTVSGDRFESIAKTDNVPNLFLDGKNGTAFLRGGLLTPFKNGTYRLNSGGGATFSTYGLQDNNNVVITGDTLGWTIAFVVPFTKEYNGFRATIINEKFESKTPVGNISASAPNGMYFFENGVKKTELTIQKYEGVDMIGYGEGNNFYGWIILNRFNTNSYNQSGFGLKLYNIGMVRSGTIIKQTTPDPISSITRVSEGRYKLTFQTPFSSANNYIVFLTCETTSYMGRFANVTAKTTTYFEVYTGDDSTPNDGDFNFMVVSTLNWT
ncbi:hypothetical protein CLV62_104147 [Dysgonomonas alginatilytica]|uniref:F5/8 type C domain-containing protein n=1 Tax=Dysgonomonas alginatilytica TaxID=1605892 RepID=A0A2V3PRQ9_9BACT|nr:hypothetical protein [Dysgonomonas alginatilytica]PXV66886.1 hypothetical protein CLV62_104147 [Dysgonomonas alginatilytica]